MQVIGSATDTATLAYGGLLVSECVGSDKSPETIERAQTWPKLDSEHATRQYQTVCLPDSTWFHWFHSMIEQGYSLRCQRREGGREQPLKSWFHDVRFCTELFFKISIFLDYLLLHCVSIQWMETFWPMDLLFQPQTGRFPPCGGTTLKAIFPAWVDWRSTSPQRGCWPETKASARHFYQNNSRDGGL